MRVQAAIAALAVLVVVFLLSLSSGRLSPASVSDVSPAPVSEPQVAPVGSGSGHGSEVSGADIGDPLMGDGTDLGARRDSGRSSQSGSGDEGSLPSERTTVHGDSGNASSPPSRPPNTPDSRAAASSGSGSGDDAGVSGPFHDDPDGTSSTSKSGSLDSSGTSGDRLEDGDTGSAVASGSSEDSSTAHGSSGSHTGSTSGPQAVARPHSSGSGSTSSGTMGAVDPTPSWKWPRCPPPVSAEPAVNLNVAKGMGWNRPTGEPFYYGQCLDADPAPPPCYCPKSRLVQRIERQLREQPVGVFKVGTGGSPKYGVVMKDGSRAMWKPWADGLAEYLSYKLAQVLGMCHAPPAVPMALVPGISELSGHQFKKTSDRGEARVKRATFPAAKESKYRSASFGIAVHIVPDVHWFMYTHTLQAAYGFGPRFGAVHEDKNCAPEYDAKVDYGWWNSVVSGRVTDAPWVKEAEAAAQAKAKAKAKAKAEAEAAQQISSGSGAVSSAGSRAAATPDSEGGGVGERQAAGDDTGGTTKARRLAAASKKAKKKKKKKKIVRKDGKRCLPNPAVPGLLPSGVSKDHRLQQTRNILAQLSDQHVLDQLICNPDRTRNQHVLGERCGPIVNIDQANGAAFHPARTSSGDQYKLTPVKLELHNGVDSLCKFRRETVDRLRLLARRVPREQLLANTTAGVSGKFVLSSGRPIPFRKDVKKQKRLCLLAGELAGSVPVPAKVTGVAGNRGMLWYARAQLRDGATLDALCNRLDALLVLVDDCVNKYGAAAVIDDLDTVAQPCDGRCNFNAHTAKAFV